MKIKVRTVKQQGETMKPEGKKRRDNADVVVRTPVQKRKSEVSHMPNIQAGGRSQ